jgi:hypothetical protein
MVCGGVVYSEGLKGRTEAFKFFIEILSVLMLQSLLVAKTGDIAVCVNIFCGLSCSSWHC